jgi:hypothetical protein
LSRICINKIYNGTTQMPIDQYNLVILTLALFQPPSEDKKKVQKKKKPKDPGARKSMEIDVLSKMNELKKEKVFSKGTPGILRWVGKSSIPFSNIRTGRPDASSKQKFCTSFTFQDRICNKPQCAYFHAEIKCDLKPSILIDLEKWVIIKKQATFVSTGDCVNGQ